MCLVRKGAMSRLTDSFVSVATSGESSELSQSMAVVSTATDVFLSNPELLFPFVGLGSQVVEFEIFLLGETD
jgi:hypothetical protein